MQCLQNTVPEMRISEIIGEAATDPQSIAIKAREQKLKTDKKALKVQKAQLRLRKAQQGLQRAQSE